MWELEKLKRFYYNGKSISNNYICAHKNGHAYIIITKVASSSPRWKLYNVQCWNSSPSLNYISKNGTQKFLQFHFQIGCMTETEHFPPNVAKSQNVSLIDFKWNTLYLHLPIWFASFYRTLNPAPGHIWYQSIVAVPFESIIVRPKLVLLPLALQFHFLEKNAENFSTKALAINVVLFAIWWRALAYERLKLSKP